MKTIIKLITSRTNWTIAAMFLIGGVQALQPVIPADIYIAVQGVLSVAAIYFKLNPSQKYGV